MRVADTISGAVAHASREGMAYWYAKGYRDGGGGRQMPGSPEEFARAYADAWLVWDTSHGMDPDAEPFVTIVNAFKIWLRHGSFTPEG